MKESLTCLFYFIIPDGKDLFVHKLRDVKDPPGSYLLLVEKVGELM